MRNKQYNLCVDMQHKGQGSKVGVAQCHKDNPSNGGEQVMFCCYFAKLCYRSVCTIKPELHKHLQYTRTCRSSYMYQEHSVIWN